MVKKVSGISNKIGGSKAIDEAKSVQTSDVKGVDSVKGDQSFAPISRVRRPTRPMNAAERQHLLQLINEEADKMFGDKGLPESKKETLKSAVRMAIEGGSIDEDD